MRETLAPLSYIPAVLRLIWRASRWYMATWAVLLIVQGLLPAAIVYLIRLLVDEIVGSIGAGVSSENVRPILVLGGLTAGVMLLTEVLRSATEWTRTVLSELVQDHISSLIHEKAVTLDLAFYESPDYHDRLERVRSDANTRSVALLTNFGGVIQHSVTLIAMGSLLIPFGLWLPAILLVSTLPAFLVVFKFNRRLHNWWKVSTPERRWANYYDSMLTYSVVAAELRLFELGSHFRHAYQTLRKKLRTERLALLRQQVFARTAAGFLSLLVPGAVMVWMVWRVLRGLATLGDLVLLYQAFNRGQTLMQTMIGNLGQIYSNSLFVKELFEFLELKPQIVDPPHPISPPAMLKQGIRFQGVEFRYPGSERLALDRFELTVPAGQTVAIVGPNGAGKSTILKLLCRFYDPASGSIELDGIDIRNMSVDDLRRRLTVLFQAPVPHVATVAHNIAFGDLPRNPDDEEIARAAYEAGVDRLIDRLPNKYDTLLGKWFAGGTQLSGGEWQRIALARAFVRQAPIMILDEPTSSMDSWAEIEWLDRFETLAAGRTAIIITHRFTTAMRADIIHVLHNGRIVESGSHHNLMKLGGVYAESWTAQTQSPGLYEDEDTFTQKIHSDSVIKANR